MFKKITLSLYECRTKNCDHSFYTSSTEQNICPNCGEDSLTSLGEFVAIITDENDEKEESIKEGIINFFSEEELPIPSHVELIMDTAFNNDELWQYLSGVRIKGDYIDKDDLEEELKSFINDNYTIDAMKESRTMVFIES